MSKYCPLLGRKVVYLECQECEDKVCEQAGTKTQSEENAFLSEQNKVNKETV